MLFDKLNQWDDGVNISTVTLISEYINIFSTIGTVCSMVVPVRINAGRDIDRSTLSQVE